MNHDELWIIHKYDEASLYIPIHPYTSLYIPILLIAVCMNPFLQIQRPGSLKTSSRMSTASCRKSIKVIDTWSDPRYPTQESFHWTRILLNAERVKSLHSSMICAISWHKNKTHRWQNVSPSAACLWISIEFLRNISTPCLADQYAEAKNLRGSRLSKANARPIFQIVCRSEQIPFRMWV